MKNCLRYEDIKRSDKLSKKERELWIKKSFTKLKDQIPDQEQLKLALSALMGHNNTTVITKKQIEELLQNVHHLCELPHISRSLFMMGGFKIIFQFFKHKEENIREQAVWIFHTCTGNNNDFKNLFLQEGGIHEIISMLKTESSSLVLNKLIGVLLNMIRQFIDGLKIIIYLDDLDLILLWAKNKTKHLYIRSIRALIELTCNNIVNQKHFIEFSTICFDSLSVENIDLHDSILDFFSIFIEKKWVSIIPIPKVSTRFI